MRSSSTDQQPSQGREAACRTGCRRPWLLVLFVLWLLALAAASVWRGVALWRTRTLLAELGSSLSPPLLVLFVVLSVLVGIGLAVSAWGLWQRREWGRLCARVLIVAYFVLVQAYIWLFSFSHSDGSSKRYLDGVSHCFDMSSAERWERYSSFH